MPYKGTGTERGALDLISRSPRGVNFHLKGCNLTLVEEKGLNDAIHQAGKSSSTHWSSRL